MKYILEMKNIVKQFPGLVANDHINFCVKPGEVHTLLGENGAGKSTLMNILTGLYGMDEGQIWFSGQAVEIDSPRKAVELGIGMVHQHFMLVQAMDVIDNIILGTKQTNYPRLDKAKAEKEILELADKYGLEIPTRERVMDISVGAQQRVEIVKALYRGAELLILDEPTAVLTPEECQGFFKVIGKLVKEGKTIIFISHKLKEVMQISDRITILRKGKKFATLDKTSTNMEELAQFMVGKRLAHEEYDHSSSHSRVVFSMKDVMAKQGNMNLKNLDIEVREGEILGIAGVDGNGQSELALLASGMLKPLRGEIVLKGEKILRFSADEFYRRKVAHIPEDRNKLGLIGGMSVSENLILKTISDAPVSKWNGLKINYGYIQDLADRVQKEYDIRASGMDCKTCNLSGGNQQKVVLARELMAEPDFIVAVHPIRGLDIGAAHFVHEQLVVARDRGCAVLLISADLDEILLLSNRIGVMYEGEIMGYEPGLEPDVNRIGQMMAGHIKAEVTHA